MVPTHFERIASAETSAEGREVVVAQAAGVEGVEEDTEGVAAVEERSRRSWKRRWKRAPFEIAIVE